MVLLPACTASKPSARRVAEDIIGSVEGLTEAQRECMVGRLDGYSDEELDVIGEENQNVDFSAENPDASEGWQKFEADLAACREAPPGSTEPEVVTSSTDA